MSDIKEITKLTQLAIVEIRRLHEYGALILKQATDELFDSGLPEGEIASIIGDLKTRIEITSGRATDEILAGLKMDEDFLAEVSNGAPTYEQFIYKHRAEQILFR